MVKVLYIYAGLSRKDLEDKVKAGEAPDTSFFGFKHLEKTQGIKAEYIELKKNIYGFGGAFFRRFAFTRSLYVFFKFYKKFSSYDIIVLTSSAYFQLLLFKKLGFWRRQKWIILNLDLSITFKKIEGNFLLKNLLLVTINTAEKIICISQAQKDDLINRGISRDKAVFIPLGVDNKFYKPIIPKAEVILTIGRDIGRDIETFLEATKLVGEPTVMICSQYNVAGLEDKIPSNLTVLFDQPYNVLKSYYEKAKVFVISTKPAAALVGSDCPGQTAVLDTLAYGMPMVATESPWFKGYFESGKELVVVPPQDPKALAEAIKKVTSDEELRMRLGREGRKLIDGRCSSEKMAKDISTLIGEITSNS